MCDATPMANTGGMSPPARALQDYSDPRLRPGWSGGVLMTAALLALGGVLSACSGGSSTPNTAADSSTTAGASVLAYSSCMRSHGVPNFPDPGTSGGIDDKQAVVSALTAVSKAVADSAQNECQHLMPAGGLGGQVRQAVPAQDQQDYLNAAACMRSHGFTNFPDPTFHDGNVSLNIPSSIDTKSAQFTQAAQVCTKLIPAGLPYSNGTGG